MDLLKKLGNLRIVTLLSGLKHSYSLKDNTSLYKKLGIKKKPWQTLSHNSIRRHDDDVPWMDKPVSDEVIRVTPPFHLFDALTQQQLLEWQKNGFLSLPGFFEKERIEKAEQSVTENLSDRLKKKYFSNRLINLYKTNKQIESLFKDASLLKLLSFILGREIRPFQTINFYKSSSQQAHSDSLHLTTEPLGYLTGVWVALEDVAAGSGEFFYYPGSHKLNYIMNEDFENKNNFWTLDALLQKKYEKKVDAVIRENELKPETFLPKKGDVLIWHANLLHGSHPKVNASLSRKSLVMHYFAKGVLCYHESTEKPVVFS